MRFFYSNFVDFSGVTITANSEDDNLPASNVANALRKRVYRSGIVDEDEYIQVDLGAAKAVTAFIVLDYTFDAADVLSIEASTVADFATSTVVATGITPAATILSTFNSATFRYWRFYFSKTADPTTFRDIGRVFIGNFYTTLEQPDYDGVKWTTNDPSVTNTSAGGQEYTDVKEKFVSLDLTFSTTPAAQVQSIVDIFEAVGIATPLFIQIDTATAPFNEVLYVKFAKSYQRSVKAFDVSYFWDNPLSFKEQI